MTIAEVSRTYDISADTLRYYERIGLIPPVPRTSGGIRDYDEESCGWIELMKCMRRAGVQVEALIEYVNLVPARGRHPGSPQGPTHRAARPAGGPNAEMQASLDRLNLKIERYDQGLMTAEKRLQRLHEEKQKS